MDDRRHRFEAPGIRVTWSKLRCIHAAECVRGLPRVFRPGERPWVQLEHAGADAVAGVIERCPTGALHHERLDGGAAEQPAAQNVVRVGRAGPLYLRGDIEVVTPEGETILRETRVALCRCGTSAHKPVCDGSHQQAHFADPGAIHDEDAVADPGAPPGRLRVTVNPGGPYELTGPFTLASADGTVTLGGTNTWLCRCGGSGSKPFCDGTHETRGFPSP